MRLGKHDYFMELAKTASRRSPCLRVQVGAVAVSQDGHVLATGYNGPPTKFPHCRECWRDMCANPAPDQHRECPSVHAEQNVIAQAAKRGISLDGSTVYCTRGPCWTCFKLLANAGVRAILVPGRSAMGDLDHRTAQALQAGLGPCVSPLSKLKPKNAARPIVGDRGAL